MEILGHNHSQCHNAIEKGDEGRVFMGVCLCVRVYAVNETFWPKRHVLSEGFPRPQLTQGPGIPHQKAIAAATFPTNLHRVLDTKTYVAMQFASGRVEAATLKPSFCRLCF